MTYHPQIPLVVNVVRVIRGPEEWLSLLEELPKLRVSSSVSAAQLVLFDLALRRSCERNRLRLMRWMKEELCFVFWILERSLQIFDSKNGHIWPFMASDSPLTEDECFGGRKENT